MKAQAEWLLELVGREPDLTLDQVAKLLARTEAVAGEERIRSAMDRFFRLHGITVKKSPQAADHLGPRRRPPRARDGGRRSQASRLRG